MDFGIDWILSNKLYTYVNLQTKPDGRLGCLKMERSSWRFNVHQDKRSQGSEMKMKWPWQNEEWRWTREAETEIPNPVVACSKYYNRL